MALRKEVKERRARNRAAHRRYKYQAKREFIQAVHKNGSENLRFGIIDTVTIARGNQ